MHYSALALIPKHTTDVTAEVKAMMAPHKERYDEAADTLSGL